MAVGSLGHSGQGSLLSPALPGCLQPPPDPSPTAQCIPRGRCCETALPLCASPGDVSVWDGSCPHPSLGWWDPCSPWIHTSPAQSWSSPPRERYAMLQFSIGVGKQQGNGKNDGYLPHGSAEGLMSLCAPQHTTTWQGQPTPAASEHHAGRQPTPRIGGRSWSLQIGGTIEL